MTYVHSVFDRAVHGLIAKANALVHQIVNDRVTHPESEDYGICPTGPSPVGLLIEEAVRVGQALGSVDAIIELLRECPHLTMLQKEKMEVWLRKKTDRAIETVAGGSADVRVAAVSTVTPTCPNCGAPLPGSYAPGDLCEGCDRPILVGGQR